MTELRVILEGDACWPDLKEKHAQGRLHHVDKGLELAALPGGMNSGRPSVALRIDLADGTTVVAETSLRALQAALRALTARFGEDSSPRGGDA